MPSAENQAHHELKTLHDSTLQLGFQSSGPGSVLSPSKCLLVGHIVCLNFAFCQVKDGCFAHFQNTCARQLLILMPGHCWWWPVTMIFSSWITKCLEPSVPIEALAFQQWNHLKQILLVFLTKIWVMIQQPFNRHCSVCPVRLTPRCQVAMWRWLHSLLLFKRWSRTAVMPLHQPWLLPFANSLSAHWHSANKMGVGPQCGSCSCNNVVLTMQWSWGPNQPSNIWCNGMCCMHFSTWAVMLTCAVIEIAEGSILFPNNAARGTIPFSQCGVLSCKPPHVELPIDAKSLTSVQNLLKWPLKQICSLQIKLIS